MIRTLLVSIITFFVSQYIIVEKANIIPKKKSYIFYNVLSVFCLYSFLNIFLWQYEINFLIVATFLYILSIAMYYVHEFRGTNLNFSDIASINTAKEVAGGYTYKIKPIFIIVLVILLFEYAFQIFSGNVNFLKYYHKAINGIESSNIDIYRYFWHEILQVFLFLVSFFLLRDKISNEKFDYSLTAGENEGYIYNFVSSIPILHKCKDSIKGVKLFKEKKNTLYLKDNPDSPHVIVIMNESFGSIHRRIDKKAQITPFYDSINGAIKGNLYVNTFGGGTANTEFEFLTGMTVGNYPYPVMPYNNFVKSDKYTLATYFNNLGYETVGMHPYTATNYHRDVVYKHFGFNKEVFIEDMKEKSYVRNFVSDDSMYKEVINRYNEVRDNHKKLFLFGVTVQNHSGYDDYNGKNSLDSYLSLMKVSDDALEYLFKYFEKEKEHVVLLFFGDHNASFGTVDNKKYFDCKSYYEFGNEYVTPFFIYDNKKKAKKYIDSVSANFLSVELLKYANLPFDDLHNLLNSVYEQYSTYNYHKAFRRKDNKIVDIPFDLYMEYEKEYLKR